MSTVSVGKRLAVNIPDTGESPTNHIKPTSSRFVFHKVMTFRAEKAMKKLIKSKATGIHNIPNKILKDSCQVIAPFLTDIFNFPITSNIFRDDLKIGKVSPVHKSGDRDDLNYYRPITVLPTITRVFERLLYGQMYTHLAENKLPGNQQFIFTSIHSTASALGPSVNKCLMSVDNDKLNSVVLLDIKKAFDTVDHKILLQKLSCYGIEDNSQKIIESYLQGRIQFCSVNGRMSAMEHIVCGVSRGPCIIGPLLFIIYMNDLPTYQMSKSLCLLMI